MRNMIKWLTLSTMGVFLVIAVVTTPSASAQTDSEECFETVISTGFDTVETSSTQELPIVDEYNNVVGFSTLVTSGPTRFEVTLLDQVAVPCDDPPDEVLGIVELAITGSDIDRPIAIGLAMIGAGGILVAAGRSRKERSL